MRGDHRVDDVRVFRRALSADEIEALYQGGGPLVALLLDEAWASDGAVLAGNATMLRMCQELGFSVAREPDDDSVRRVVLRLT